TWRQAVYLFLRVRRSVCSASPQAYSKAARRQNQRSQTSNSRKAQIGTFQQPLLVRVDSRNSLRPQNAKRHPLYRAFARNRSRTCRSFQVEETTCRPSIVSPSPASQGEVK